MELSPATPNPLRWTSDQCSAGHRKCILRPQVSLLQRLPAGALRQARSSQPGRSPVSRSPSPDGPEETKPASWSPSPVWRQSVLRPRVGGGFGAPCGCRRRAGSPVLPEPRGLPQKQLCGERSDWKPKPKWSQIAPPLSSKHGKEQSQPVWDAAIKRITSEARLMKWMNLEHIKQGSQSEREKPGL